MLKSQNAAQCLSGLHDQGLIEINIKRGFQIAAAGKEIRHHTSEGHIVEIPAFHPTPVGADQGEADGQEQCGGEGSVMSNPGGKGVEGG